MALPTLITVAGDLFTPDGEPDRATVTFEVPNLVRQAAGDDVMMRGQVFAATTDAGLVTLQVPATDDPGWSPVDWTYRLTIRGTGGTVSYDVAVPYSSPGAAIDLGDLVPAIASGGELYAPVSHTHAGYVTEGDVEDVVEAELATALVPYATDTELAAAIATRAALVHTHVVSAITGLQAALDALQPRDEMSDYVLLSYAYSEFDAIRAEAIAGDESVTTAYIAADAALQAALEFTINSAYDLAAAAITPAELTDALAAYLPDTGSNTYIGDLTLADNVAAAKAYRMRSSGGSLDFEGAGADLYFSVWSTAAFGGTQRIYLRLEYASSRAVAVGRWDWAVSANPGTAVHSLDPVTGVAALGGKNSSTALRFSGYRTAIGPPASGTWILGDLIMDSNQQWWRCTVAGTPGTWATLVVPDFSAADINMAGWTFDPAMIQGGTILVTSGLSYVFRIKATAASVTNILIHATAGGTVLTAGQCFASLHNAAGVQIGVTADQAAAWASGGLKTMALAGGPVAVTPGAWYYVRLWFNGTTGPTLSRAGNSSSAIINAGLAAPNLRYATADTGLTTAGAAPSTIGTQTGAATAWWTALS